MLVAVLTGCGSATSTDLLVPRQEGAPTPYSGSLDIAVPDPDADDVLARSGAAGRALECKGPPANGGVAGNGGPVEPAETPEDALRAFLDDGYGVPHRGYRVEVSNDSRVLFSYDVDQRTRASVVVVKDALARGAWAMETFALCDQAEFDPSADEDLPGRVWVDRNGKRVPTTVVSSAFGSDHCDWETVTFLSLRGRQFVADPEGALDKLAVEKLAAYRQHTKLPADATDTGYRLDRRELWRAAHGNSVFVVTDEAVEQWPALKEPLYCM